MFCNHCGHNNDDSAVFCNKCGKTVAATSTGAVVSQEKAVEKSLPHVFLEKDGVLVNDAVFRVSSGQSFPIRNITSVSVTRGSNSFLILVVIAFVFGGLLLSAAGIPGPGVMLILLAIPFIVFIFNRTHSLNIGAGGVFQIALKHKNGKFLESIASAINESISHIQRS